MSIESNGLTLRGGGGRRPKPDALKPIVTSGAGNAGFMPPEEEPLSPGARLFHEARVSCFILASIGITTPFELEVVKQGLRETLIKHPRFCSNLVVDAKKGGKKTWVRTHVNLDDHLVIADLDKNINSPDQFVEDYISNLTTIPMDMSKPLWELHVLNIRTSDAVAVGVFRIHHSLGDGVSLISLLLACTRKTSDPNSLPSIPMKKEVAALNRQNAILRYLFVICFICKVLWNTLVDMALILATAFFLKDAETPVKGSPGTEKKRKRIVYKILSLDDIKLIKNQMNVTINDVVLGMTQAGLSRYLNRRYGNISNLYEAEDMKDNLPKNIRLRATALVNVRPSGGIQELASLMEKGSKCPWGNAIACVIIPFKIGLKDKPLDYIREAKAIADKKKQSLETNCTYASGKLMLHLLGAKAAADISYKLGNRTTMSLSNVVGPVEEISFYGYPISYIAPTVYGHPQALTIHYQSHVDKMIIVVAVDEDVIPDPRVLCDDVAHSLRLFKASLIKNGK